MKHAHGRIWGDFGFLLVLQLWLHCSLPIMNPQYLCRKKEKKVRGGMGKGNEEKKERRGERKKKKGRKRVKEWQGEQRK